MRGISSITLASMVVLSTSAAAFAEGEEFSADYLAGAVVELFHAHGLTIGSYGRAWMEGEALMIEALRASDAEGHKGFFAERVQIRGIEELDEGPEPWLALSEMSMSGVNMAMHGYALQLSAVQAGKLMLLNSNTPDDQKRNGYKYIDGPLGAFRFSSVSLETGYMLKDGEALFRIDSADAKAGGWLAELTTPSTASFRMNGSVFGGSAIPGLAGGETAVDTKGSLLVDVATGLASANVSATSPEAGEAIARVAITGVNRKVLGKVSEWIAGNHKSGAEALSDVKLSRLAVGTRGVAWTAPFGTFLNASDGFLSSETAKFAKQAWDWVTSGEASAVAEVEPSGHLPLSELAVGGNASEKDLGPSFR